MHNLNQFLREFRYGFQQSNRFTCHIYAPPTLLDAILTDNKLIQVVDVFFPNIGRRIDGTFSSTQVADWLRRGLLVSSTRLPDRSFEQTNLNIYGITERFPTHSEFTSLDVNLLMPLVSNDNAVPRFFYYWQNFIQNNYAGPESGLDFRFPSEYYATVYLTQWDREKHATVSYRFDKAYPAKVDTVQVDWNSENEMVQLPVSFTYSYWTMLPFEAPPLISVDINI